MKVLDGVRVLEVSQGVDVQLAGVVLAELGADVVRVETDRPGPLPPAFYVANRSKRSVRLADDAAGRADLGRLVVGADVLLCDLPAAARQQRGIDDHTVQELNSCLVIAEVSAYGAAEGHERLPQSSVLAAGLSGHVASQWAFRDGGTYPVNDFGSAINGILTATGVVAALVAAGRDARPRTMRTSTLGAWLSLRSLHAVVGEGVTSVSARDPQGGLSPLSRFYPAADGKWLILACSTSQFWGKLCIALDQTQWCADPRFEQAPFGIPADHRPALVELLTNTFAKRNRNDWIEVLRSHDVPCAPANSPLEAFVDPQASTNRTVVEVEQPGVGPVRQVGPPIRIENHGVSVRGPAPALGAHTGEVLREWSLPSTYERATATAGTVDGEPDRPLAGVRVLEICNWVAGPTVGTMLRSLGAEVWKLESCRGDDVRGLMYVYRPVNAGKKVLRIDLDTPAGRDVLHRLVRFVDAVYHNQRPTTARKLGIDEQSLRTVKADLVYHQIHSFGPSGPLAGDPAFDQLVPTRAGLSYLQGGMVNGSPPVMHNGSQGDLPAGYVGALAVCAGLLSHQRGAPKGFSSWSVLFEAGYLLGLLESVQYPGRPPMTNGGVDFLGPDPAHRLYRSAGDGWVLVAADDEPAWQSIAALTGLSLPPLGQALSEDAEGALGARIAARLVGGSARTWADEALRIGAPLVEPVPDGRVCLTQPVVDNGYDSRAAMDDGSAFVFPGSFVQMRVQPREGVLTSPDRTPGSRQVLAAVGFTPTEIDELCTTGVVVLGEGEA